MQLIELAPDEIVDSIRITLGLSIDVTYYNRVTRSSATESHPYSRQGAADVTRYAMTAGLHKRIATRSDAYWSYVPF